MNLIRVNYNNVAVKNIKKIVPYFYCYKSTVNGVETLRIEIDAKLDEEKYYTDFMFEIYINDTLMTYITKGSPKENGLYYLIFTDIDALSEPTFTVKLKGHYLNKDSSMYSFERDPVKIDNYLFVKEELVCSEKLIVTDYSLNIYGYYNEEKFYKDRTGTIGSYEYTNEINGEENPNANYIDIPSETIYKWNSNTNEFKVLL